MFPTQTLPKHKAPKSPAAWQNIANIGYRWTYIEGADIFLSASGAR